jgi:hypothetical protein
LQREIVEAAAAKEKEEARKKAEAEAAAAAQKAREEAAQAALNAGTIDDQITFLKNELAKDEPAGTYISATVRY